MAMDISNNFRNFEMRKDKISVNDFNLLVAKLKTDGQIVYLNQSFASVVKEDLNAYFDHAFYELECFVHSEEIQNRIMFTIEDVSVELSHKDIEVQLMDLKGELVNVDLHFKYVAESLELCEYVLCYGYSITNLMKTRKALNEKDRELSALFQNSSDGYFFNMLPVGLEITGDDSQLSLLINDSIKYQSITRINPALLKMIDLADGQCLITNRIYELFKFSGIEYNRIISEVIKKGHCVKRQIIRTHLGEEKTLEINFMIIQTDEFFYGIFGVVRNLTAQLKYEKELEFYANFDPLTELWNRRTFFKKTNENYVEHPEKHALAMLDIDHFKRVNDTYGHEAGDRVLKIFAREIRSSFSNDAYMCRYGGEEFILYFLDYEEERVLQLLEWFRMKIEKMVIETETYKINITVSAGFTALNESDLTIDLGISRADSALYLSKNNGRNRITKV